MKMKIESKLNCPHCGQELDLDNIFSQQNTLYNLLKKLMNEGGNDNFLVIQLDENYYIQAASSKGSLSLLCEAVSNKYLPPHKELNTVQHQRLLALGWNTPNPSSENYWTDTPLITDEVIVQTVQRISATMKEVYGFNGLNNNMITLNLE